MENPPSDEDLLASWLLGESWAFEAFFQRHSGRVTAYASRKGILKDEVPEVVQDIFLKLHSNIDHFEIGKRALPWFFTLVHHTCLDHLKRGGKSKARLTVTTDFDLEGLPAAEPPEGCDLSADLSGALLQLEPFQQSILDMRLIEELSFQEISTRTGKSEVSLRKAYSRALQSLRHWVGLPKGKK